MALIGLAKCNSSSKINVICYCCAGCVVSLLFTISSFLTPCENIFLSQVFCCPSDPVICIQALSVIYITTKGRQACTRILQDTVHQNSFKPMGFPSADNYTVHFEILIFIRELQDKIKKIKYMDTSTGNWRSPGQYRQQLMHGYYLTLAFQFSLSPSFVHLSMHLPETLSQEPQCVL